jgi:glycerol-3-phosphate dehydrogenase (NAD+)
LVLIVGNDTARVIIANIAGEVADKVFSEGTVGSRHVQHSDIIRQLIDRPYFRVNVYPDVEIIEILGALKNIVAMLTGFADGLHVGFNTRAAVRNITSPLE